ncbi:MAG: hypothetical protein BJ554DRAFT_7285, partial [Olpidium bornovanus]
PLVVLAFHRVFLRKGVLREFEFPSPLSDLEKKREKRWGKNFFILDGLPSFSEWRGKKANLLNLVLYFFALAFFLLDLARDLTNGKADARGSEFSDAGKQKYAGARARLFRHRYSHGSGRPLSPVPRRRSVSGFSHITSSLLQACSAAPYDDIPG